MLPNILTMSRIFSIPLIIICFFQGSYIAHCISFILFIFACITDFLDGYLAREFYKISKLGRFLDPIADKILVSCSILLLVGFDYINGIDLIPSLIILSREILVSGMREFLSELNVPLPVSNIAKIKTATQMIALSLIMLGLCNNIFIIYGIVTLWAASILTLITGYKYLKLCMSHLQE